MNPPTRIRYRSWLVWSVLVGSILVSYAGAFSLKLGLPLTSWAPWFWRGLGVVLAVKVGALLYFRVDRGMWRYADVGDLISTALALFSSSALLMGLCLALRLPVFLLTTLVIDLLISLLLLSAARMSLRISQELLQGPREARRTIVIGAGDAGEAAVRAMVRQPRAKLTPVALVDDDPLKQGLHVHGVPVEGTIAELPELARRLHAETILVAIGRDLGPERMREIMAVARSTQLPVQRIPPLDEMINGRAFIDEWRDFSMEDLLTRAPVRTDREKVSKLLAAETILVTGAAGSIGSELCRQILQHEPARLILLDQDENALYEIEHELKARQPRARCIPVLASVRDVAKLERLFNQHEPSVVFHAAAYKHVPVLEHFPEEAVRNNVLGTRNVARLADRYRCKSFVFISTDKAVRPTSVMGTTKRVAELIVGALDERSHTRYAIIRFGNVLGSNGSVIQLFRRQIARGGPVTVTHPDIRRYFMSIPEAVELVLFAAAMDRKGGTYILDMGKQVRIMDLARHFIRLCGLVPEKDIPIEIVGLRPGEKLFEELWTEEEHPEPTGHPSILCAQRGSRDREQLEARVEALIGAAEAGDRGALYGLLRELVPSYHGVRQPEDAADLRVINGHRKDVAER